MFGLVGILYTIALFFPHLFQLPYILAYNEQANEDGDKPGFVAMLQKVLQLYASRVLSKRSYAMKGILQSMYSILLYTKFMPK